MSIQHNNAYSFGLLLWLLILSPMLYGQSAAGGEALAFSFDPARIEPGMVYHYTKSNIDGSRPIRVSLYQESVTAIEVYKYEKGYKDAARIVATMDWEQFTPGTVDAYVMTADSTRQTASLKWEQDRIVADVHVLGHALDTVYPVITPAHMYNFDFTSLNLTFKFLKNPEGSFTIGIVDPTYAEQGDDIFYYRGKATITYEGDGHGGRDRKYSITGRGMNFTKGYIWVAKAHGMITDMEIPIPDNPGWTSFKFKLEYMEKMTKDEWHDYLRSGF